jgi:DsbC/DsbD-like thiol-disulfide interchange protein
VKTSLLVAVLTVATAFAAVTQPPTPVKWSIKKAPAEASAGQTVVIQFAAQIDDGWHLYALDQPYDGPIPTTITVSPQPLFSLNPKEIERPDPEKIDDASFGVETHHYTRSVVFGLPVKVAADAAAGQREIEIAARFQACSDKVCLRPTTVTRKATIKITPAPGK